jgi:hypothetical protein
LKTSETDLAIFQVSDQFDQMPQRPAQAIEAPDNEGVAGSGQVKGLVESRTCCADSGDFVDEDSLASGAVQSILLKIEILVVS